MWNLKNNSPLPPPTKPKVEIREQWLPGAGVGKGDGQTESEGEENGIPWK